MTPKPYQADGLLLLVAISWGVTFAMVQEAIRDVPVYTFLFWRFSAAFVLMLAVVHRALPRVNRATVYAGAVLGILNITAYILQTFGLAYTLASSVAFLTGLFVIMVPLMAFFLFRQHIARSVWAGIIMVLPGLWLLTTRGVLHAGLGEWLGLGCAFFFALHLLYTDRFSRRYDVPLLVAFQFGMMGLGSGIMGLAFDHTLWPRHFSAAFWWALGVTVLFATVFAFWVQTSMQRYTTPSRAALIFTMEPLSAALFAYGYTGETMSGWQIAGGGLILGGVLWAELGAQKERS